MSSKSKKRRPQMVSINKATTAAESVALGNLNIWEIRDAIRDEHGWEIA